MTKLLYDAARHVVSVSQVHDVEVVAHAINKLEHAMANVEVASAEEIQRARELYHQEGSVEIDPFAYASRTMAGSVWVQAWVRLEEG